MRFASLPSISRFVLLGLASAGSLLGAVTYDHQAKEGLKITLPDDWNEIPHEQIVEMTETLRQQAPGAKVPDFSLGYQLKSDHWFSYPYILIWVTKKGRVSDRELAQLDSPALARQVEKGTKDYERIVSGFEMGKPVLDSQSQIIWMNSEANFANVGRVGILNAGVLTSQGVTWIYGYAPIADFEKYKPTFIEIARSIQLTDALRIHPLKKPGATPLTSTPISPSLTTHTTVSMPDIPKPIPHEEKEAETRADIISKWVGIAIGFVVGLVFLVRKTRGRKSSS